MARTGAAQAGSMGNAAIAAPNSHDRLPVWTNEDEAACIEQLRLRDAALYQEQAPTLQRYFARRVPSADVADLVQESFRRVLGHASKRPGAILGRTAANLLLEVRRAAARRWSRAHEPFDDQHAPTCDPVAQLEARDALARIERALARLKPKTRDIFLMTRVEGRSYAEVGTTLGMSEEAVKKQVAKAMWHVRRQVGDI